MPVRIEPANLTESDAITQVHIASWLTTYRGLIPDQTLDQISFQRRREMWQKVLLEDPTRVLVARDDGQVIGFAHFGTELSHDPVYHGELYAIYLLQDYQRQGWGARLIQSTAQGLLQRGFTTMLVWVLAQNPACAFYEKLGGLYLRQKPVEFNGVTLMESAYGWDDLRTLLEKN